MTLYRHTHWKASSQLGNIVMCMGSRHLIWSKNLGIEIWECRGIAAETGLLESMQYWITRIPYYLGADTS